jgi:glycosidase
MKSDFKEYIYYQIYVRSFKDSNGDGIGDLNGITSKLDYLKDLGVDVLWLTPFFSSPNDDNGYDISDYENIMQEFGTMEDFDHLIEEAHARDLRIMMDLVLNHTSDEHPWFLESKSSRTNPKHDWYVWIDGDPGKLPNDWQSFFSGPAWDWNEERKQYYLHHFSRKQPDLNWENPEVRREFKEIILRWMDRGIDAFRLDAIHLMAKKEGYPDRGPMEYEGSTRHFSNLPRLHDYLRELKTEAFEKGKAITVGETSGLTPDTAGAFVNHDEHKLDMIFHFDLLWTPNPGAKEFLDFYMRWYEGLHEKGWDAIFLGNHDTPRAVSSYGDETYRRESATLLAALNFTAFGSPFIYQGEEIGMTNIDFASIEDYQDIQTVNEYHHRIAKGEKHEDIFPKIKKYSRDNSRTPMQWDSSPFAGFSDSNSWLKLNPNYKEINVERETKDPQSVLSFYKKLIALRKSEGALIYGTMERFPVHHEDLIAFTRTLDGESLLIIGNMGSNAPRQSIDGWKCILSNHEVQEDEDFFHPWEIRIYRNN